MPIMILMFLIGLGIPFIFYKVESNIVKWIPAGIFVLGAIFMFIKARFFPAPEMAALGEVIYFIFLVLAAIGSIIGAVILMFIQNKTVSH